MTAALSSSRAPWTIVTPGVAVIVTVITVVTTVMTIAAAIVIIITSVFAVTRAGSPFGFFGVGVSVRRLNQLANDGRPLAVQLPAKLLVSKPFGKGSDGLGIGDVGDGVSCL